MTATEPRPDVRLSDRYTAGEGAVAISGIQALVRLLLDQRHLDERRGLDTAAFVSGYEGSPLGRLDLELGKAREHLDAAGVVFQPGLNEELAATAVAGTQLLGEVPGARHQGVTGYWYGKNPGLDRAADAIRHANLAGTSPKGGVVALIGDDPSAKSSTVPSSCEPICASMHVPLLAPGSVGGLLELGLHAVALSRHSGLWAGLKIVADTADASATVDVQKVLAAIPELPARDAAESPVLLPPKNLAAERDLFDVRLERAREYARVAELNRIVSQPSRARMAIVSAGMGHQAVVRALDDLGLDSGERDRLGLRVIEIGMPWPTDRDDLRRLLAGVEAVLVVEDKLPFLETRIKEALYRTPDAPLVLGQEDSEGRPLIPTASSVGADDVERALGRVIDEAELPERARARLARLNAAPAAAPAEPLARRTPYFCSGCPHNTSTRAGADELVGTGIGCHIMVALDQGDRRGQLVGMTQMGGEGSQWIGLAPFTDDPHFVQNMGDGTFHHSGSLSVRAAVAAGVSMTFKLLYNDAVAMTGGQRPEGRLGVPALTRVLADEGVRRIVVTTPEPGRYRGIELAPIASVRHRDEMQAAHDELAAIEGVTVLIHDDMCATEKRRLRKRGKLAQPKERVWINERVCEGCGDCGEQSTCLSVQPVQTEFGRKTTIHQASCNSDMSCLKGDCPSFVLVTPKGDKEAHPTPDLPVELTEPQPIVPEDVLVRMPGVGGTGVVTVSAIVQMAAHLDGRHASGLEQIGLAQKGGPVLSDVRIASEPVYGQLRASAGSVDVLIGLDLLGAAAPETLSVCDPDRTVAVLSTDSTPTALMVTDPSAPPADSALALRRVEEATREVTALHGLALSERLFGDHMQANLLMVGAAYQHGCLPISADSIERAIELNGAAVERNLAAFRWGRAAVQAPGTVRAALAEPEPDLPPLAAGLASTIERSGVEGELRRLLEIRCAELTAYQSAAYAERYLADVLRVAAVENERAGASAVAEAYARGLHKLMAYKDEYEVARLHLDAAERARRDSEFGGDAHVRIQLHPPMLRALGMKRKIGVGPWLFGVLRAGRRLRGHAIDPFGHTDVRRTERSLIGEYRELIDRALEHLSPRTAGQVEAIAALPEVVRGYEDIKLASVAAFRTQAETMMATLAALDRPAPLRELPVIRHQAAKR